MSFRYVSYVVWLATCMCLTRIEAQGADVNVDFIKAALETADSSVTSLNLQCTTWFEVADISQVPDMTKRNESIAFLMKDSHARWEFRDFDNNQLENEQLFVYDGEKGIGHNPGKHAGVIQSARTKILGVSTIPHPTKVAVWDTDLIERIHTDPLALLPERQTVDGKSCYVLEGRPESSGAAQGGPVQSYRIYVDPDVGYMPRMVEERIQERTPTGEMTERVHKTKCFMDYKDAGQGLWFPMKATETAHPANGRPDWTNLYVVDKLEINQPVEESVFTITFPPGTQVRDEILGIYYTVGATGAPESDKNIPTTELTAKPSNQASSGISQNSPTSAQPMPTPGGANSVKTKTNTVSLALALACCVLAFGAVGYFVLRYKKRH